MTGLALGLRNGQNMGQKVKIQAFFSFFGWGVGGWFKFRVAKICPHHAVWSRVVVSDIVFISNFYSEVTFGNKTNKKISTVAIQTGREKGAETPSF